MLSSYFNFFGVLNYLLKMMLFCLVLSFPPEIGWLMVEAASPLVTDSNQCCTKPVYVLPVTPYNYGQRSLLSRCNGWEQALVPSSLYTFLSSVASSSTQMFDFWTDFFCRSSIFGWRQVFNPEQVPEVLFSALIMPPLIATQKVENGAPSPNSQDQQFGLLVQCRWERFLFQILKWNDEQDGHISFIMGRCLLVESWGYFEQLPVGTWHKGFPFSVCFGILFNVSNLPNVPDWWITNPNCSQNVPY